MSKQQLDNLILTFLPFRDLLFPVNAKIRFCLGFISPPQNNMQFFCVVGPLIVEH